MKKVKIRGISWETEDYHYEPGLPSNIVIDIPFNRSEAEDEEDAIVDAAIIKLENVYGYPIKDFLDIEIIKGE